MKTKSMTIWLMVVILCLTSPKAMSWIQFKGGGTHNIDYEISDDVWVDYQAPDARTTVNWLDGGQMNFYCKMQVFEDSVINILGGSMDDHLYAWDSSQVTVSGGSIDSLWAYDRSQLSISGGSIGHIYADNSSRVSISGGTANGYLYASDSSQVTVSGGSFGEKLQLADNAVLTLHGWDFAVDGTPFGYGELTSILGGSWSNEPHRYLTGTLLSGDPINNGFYIGNNASIVLIPEPATILLLGLGAPLLRKRR